MLHKHIKSLPHHPKRVIVISLILALAIGFFSYMQINKKIANPEIAPDSATTNANSSGAHNITLGFLSGGRIKSVSIKTGDSVKKGQALATLEAENISGALTQAKALYATAQASLTIAKAKNITNNTNLATVTAQQDALVANSYRTLLSSNLQAIPNSVNESNPLAPIISGSYDGLEGSYIIHFYPSNSNSGVSFSMTGLETGYTEPVSVNSTVPIGTHGLYITFGSNVAEYINGSENGWTISIPNTKSATYTANDNAYISAETARDQAIAQAEASIGTNSSDNSVAQAQIAQAQAQVDSALGAVQIAQANYDNTIITAPGDGTVISVNIAPGQIAVPNAPAIQLIVNN